MKKVLQNTLTFFLSKEKVFRNITIATTSTLQKMTKMAVKNEKPLGVRLLCYCRNKKEIGLPTLTSYGDTNTGFALTLEP